MYTDPEDITYHECPRCHQKYLFTKSGLCKLCLEHEIENEDVNDEEYPEDYLEHNGWQSEQ